MTEEEYDKKVKEINSKYNGSLFFLANEYATENSVVKKGDIVADANIRILVKWFVIRFIMGQKYPSMEYIGPRLKKDNTPFKDGEEDSVFQYKMKTINGVKVTR